MTFRNLETADLAGKRALVRVDFNVPMEDGRITDDTRLISALPTIRFLSLAGARVVLLAHFDRPKGRRVPEMSLKPVVELECLKRHHGILAGLDDGREPGEDVRGEHAGDGHHGIAHPTLPRLKRSVVKFTKWAHIHIDVGKSTVKKTVDAHARKHTCTHKCSPTHTCKVLDNTNQEPAYTHIHAMSNSCVAQKAVKLEMDIWSTSSNPRNERGCKTAASLEQCVASIYFVGLICCARDAFQTYMPGKN
jgi:hypothetical protein